MQDFKGIIFASQRLKKRKKIYNICYFSYKICFLFDVIFFLSEKDPDSKNCFTYSEESKLSKTHKNVSSYKRQSQYSGSVLFKVLWSRWDSNIRPSPRRMRHYRCHQKENQITVLYSERKKWKIDEGEIKLKDMPKKYWKTMREIKTQNEINQ